MTRVPASFRLAPIDEHARNGRAQLVFGHRPDEGEEFAIAAYRADDWRMAPSGLPLGFEPEKYLP